jgi:serine/threonine protein kinase/tetratricopeptide (TPR) repeat protein
VSDAAERSPDSQLDELVFGYLERAELEPTRAPAMLAELCQSNPGLASELRQRVELLVRSGLWKPAPSAESDVPERLGDFRLIRRLGGGGMGVVFLAEQVSVGRRVALKLIRAEQLFFHGARVRFLREAQAIARMDHPNIVQVLTVGEEAGVPYLAMEYVEGCPLDELVAALKKRTDVAASGVRAREVLAERLGAASGVDWNAAFFERGWVELCLRIAREIAAALQHAHQRGVLHRDVKPSNVLVTPGGRVRLLDFGLAALSNESGLTRTGTQMGSLPYMAPEQVDGRTELVGPATDVYGLGVTLYELLALRRAFDGANEMAVRKAVLEARPAPIRSLNPAVPPDVETVVAKAMESDPARRYASAADFARDLGNLLELRPIEARPPSRLHRVVRWTQRRPAAAVALVLGALLLVAGPLGWELNRVRTMRQVREAYERSERDFQSAFAAIGHVLADTATEELEDVPRMQKARLVAIDHALELFEGFARDREGDADVLAEGGELYESRGEVLRDLGRPDEALVALERAVEFHRRASSVRPDAVHSSQLAAALVQRAKCFSALFRAEDGLPLLDEALALVRANVAADPQAAKRRRDLFMTLIAKGETLQILARDDQARPLFEEGLACAENLARGAPESYDFAWNVGRAKSWLATLADRAGNADESLRLTQESLAAFERASELAPGQRYYAYDCAEANVALAQRYFDRGDFERGRARVDAASAVVDELLRDFPESIRYRDLRSEALNKLAAALNRERRFPEALEIVKRLVDEHERTYAIAPERCDLAFQLARALNNLGAVYLDSNQHVDEVPALMQRGETVLATCERQSATNSDVAAVGAMLRYARALALCHLDRLEPARAAIETYAGAAGTDPMRLRYAADLWNEYLLGLRRAHADVASEAEPKRAMFDLLRRAIDAGYRAIDELKSTPALDSFRSEPEFVALLARIKA